MNGPVHPATIFVVVVHIELIKKEYLCGGRRGGSSVVEHSNGRSGKLEQHTTPPNKYITTHFKV